ncbi:hypothetical protein GQL56_23820 [Pseudomonas putida]|nr:hypothetical protein [Pseudomonas putida]
MNPIPSSPEASYTADDARAARDRLIFARAPEWLRNAPLARLKPLHEALLAHEVSRKALVEATRLLESPHQFAEKRFRPLIEGLLPEGPQLEALEWVDTNYVPGPSTTVPVAEPRYTRLPALLRLMQNFPAEPAPFSSGLAVAAAIDAATAGGALEVLVDDNGVIERCRALDAGASYQAQLNEVFTTTALGLLANHKRTAFALSSEMALCQAQISHEQYQALQRLQRGEPFDPAQPLHAAAGQLQMLTCKVENALKIQLRDADGEDRGVILYLPDDPLQVLRSFISVMEMDAFLQNRLSEPEFRRQMAQRIRLRDRAQFVHTLETRLMDDEPDLQLQGTVPSAPLFAEMAADQVERLKDDGRLLLVSTDDADEAAARLRLERWKAVGLSALSLAGLGIPVVGVVLFGLMVADTLKQVYEGAKDWSEGHQHEALQHLFSVAETVAITALTIAGAAAVAKVLQPSAFVDTLEPVNSTDGPRLWRDDLQPYEHPPVDPQLQANGLYADGDWHLLRIEERYYALHQDAPGKAWRLRHAQEPAAYGPPVEFNGERCWRIRSERPLEWDDSTQMLRRLWPMEPPLDSDTAKRVLRVAGIDSEGLRGLLVENRPLPVNLRDTLQRYTAASRIAAVFEALEVPGAELEDPQILAWCKARAEMQGLSDQEIAERLLARRQALRTALLGHLAQDPPLEGAVTPAQDTLLERLHRVLPGLPSTYATEAVADVAPVLRQMEQVESRVPMAVMNKARALLGSARLTRAMEGLLLDTDYNHGTGELVLALLPRVPHWPSSLNIELREDLFGRRIGILNPQGAPESCSTLIWRNGTFRLFDSQGSELETEVDEPGGLFQAISGLLTRAQRQAMGISEDNPAEQLRQAAIGQLPEARSDVINRLGWTQTPGWFNPVRRLPDGRVGYPLGGMLSRQDDILDALARRVRGLYPSLSDEEVEGMIQQWLSVGRDPFDELLAQEMNFASLEDALLRWEREGTGMGMRSRRRQFANRLRAAWRYEGDVVMVEGSHAMGRVLSIEGWRVGPLPPLPHFIDFSHILELRMSGMDLLEFPRNFLRWFDSLQILNLNNNLLTTIPEEIARLPMLRVLQLKSNQIRLDAAGAARLSGLQHLRTLVLDFNPLRTLDLDFARMTQLRVLKANRCSLLNLPQGLEHCRHLALADLRFNQISTIPNGLLAMPRAFRRGVNLEGNAVSHEVLAAFIAGDGEEPVDVVGEVPGQGERLYRWLGNVDEAERQRRTALWGRIQGASGSTPLMELLAQLTLSQDYLTAPDYLQGQVWQLLKALDQDAELRQELFANAGIQLTCHDSVAERFSRLWVRTLVHAAEKTAATGTGGNDLLNLGRALFRMDRLDAFAREQVLQREGAGEAVDELEVVLGFRVRLAERLGLVGQPRSMLFTTIANITPEQEQSAYDTVTADETTARLAQSLSSRGFWGDYLKLRHAGLIDSYLKPYADQATALEDSHEAGEMREHDYKEAYDRLKRERDNAEHGLMVIFSEDLIEQAAAGRALDPVAP